MRWRGPYSLAGFAALTILALPPAAYSGELNGKKIDAGVHYKITRCDKPKAPKLKAKTVEEFNAAAARYEAYAKAQQVYADCIGQEAQQDSKDIQNAIYEGAQAQIARIQSDLDAERAYLDSLQRKLQDETQ